MSTEEEDKLTEKLLLDQGMWSSKTLWKVVTGVAVGVFVITMIYAQFLTMGKDLEAQKVLHTSDMKHLEAVHRAEMSAIKEVYDNKLEVLEARQVKQRGDISDLEKLSHARGK